jgi:eukaryotic-like serine/threonine-protein kinase
MRYRGGTVIQVNDFLHNRISPFTGSPIGCRPAALVCERPPSRAGPFMEKTHLDPTGAAPPVPPEGSVSSPTASSQTSSPHPPDPATEIRSLGEYRFLRLLGEGGMSKVYLGYDAKNGRQVAVKVLNDSLASNPGYVQRFYREARSGTQLNHPNIVHTYFVGQDRTTGKHYLVLEFVEGQSAHALLQERGQLTVGDAVHIALDVARALEHAHSRSIIHRDIKPDNILITPSGVAKLNDFGLSKRTDEASNLTQARQGFGTTAYMPYEQAISAKDVDGRSDIYALGATLYHLLTGAVPFPGDHHLDVVEKKNKGFYRPASALNPAVPAALDQILGRMLARDPRDRFQTASEVIIDLERSKLPAAIPSFADPDMARKDPWVQACLSSGEPTRLDPTSGGVQTLRGSKAAALVEWIVRYSNRSGRVCTTRITTEHVLERLHEGTLPVSAEARLPTDEVFQPLSNYAEFRDHLPSEEVESRPRTPPAPAKTKTALLAFLGAAFVTAGVLIAILRWFSHG